jgi:bacteriorhodopsin
MVNMKNKYDKNFWILMMVSFPLLWLFFPYIYFTGDECFRGRGMIVCGGHAIVVMIATFCFSMLFPFYYYKTVRHKIKEQDMEEKNT